MVWMASIFKARSLELLDTDNKGVSTNRALKAYKEITRKAEALVIIKEISGDVYEVERGGGGKRGVVKLPQITLGQVDMDNAKYNAISEELVNGECTCRTYQEYLTPYMHGIAAIRWISRNPINYFYRVFGFGIYQEIYQQPIQTVNTEGIEPQKDMKPPKLWQGRK
jgi:hypothetical protein